MKKLSASQEKILSYLRKCAQDGIPPSVREICHATGLKSTSTVHAHLKTLEKNGYISREARLNRAIHVSGSKSIMVPIIKDSFNGKSYFSEQDIDGYIAYNAEPQKGHEFFAFKMPDQSMKNSNILPNDIMIACKKSDFNNGDIVIAVCNKHVLIRHLFKDDKKSCLFADNVSFVPITINENIIILGKVISLIRNF